MVRDDAAVADFGAFAGCEAAETLEEGAFAQDVVEVEELAGGVDVDLIQAHKWFNLAAMSGNAHGQQCRAEIADDMTAREIAEAQRQARAWLNSTMRRAA